jgi:hypothetical protein
MNAPTHFSIAMLMSAFFSIAYYGVIELNLRILLTFKRRQGLYFWSLFIATWGIALNTTGFIPNFFNIILSIWISTTLSIIGWIFMVTGQSTVLYSRLHLVLYDNTKRRGVLALIITNAFVCHLPVAILFWGVSSSHPATFRRPYEIYERVQLTIFALQEMLISSMYIYYTAGFFGPEIALRGTQRRAMMKQLILINVILIILDVLVVGLQFAGLYEIQISFKVAVYSIKLRLEFDVLNHLLRLTRNPSHNFTSFSNHEGTELLPRAVRDGRENGLGTTSPRATDSQPNTPRAALTE